jgi:inorganic pyrophosphatase
MNKITSSRDYIGKAVTVGIDRPLHSAHPKYGWKYEANYGFVPGTMSPDGEELDAYVLGVTEPLKTFQGKCIAVIHRLDDDDDKLVIIPENAQGLSDEEIKKLTYFQEQFFTSEIWR